MARRACGTSCAGGATEAPARERAKARARVRARKGDGLAPLQLTLEKMPKVTSCTSSQGIELGSVSGTVHSGTLAAAALPPSSSLCAIGAAAKGG